jgi:hypothetical protein
MGKSRRAAKLPLPQDVGDAVLDSLHTARPSVPCNAGFITTLAPWQPITSPVVTTIAARAIQRAGVDAPSFGAPVLRHSAATGLLRQGASLQVIGAVLRHQSVETTAHDAQVDVGVFQPVTMPWPGAASGEKTPLIPLWPSAVRVASNCKTLHCLAPVSSGLPRPKVSRMSWRRRP